jgi:hypothetical protein
MRRGRHWRCAQRKGPERTRCPFSRIEATGGSNQPCGHLDLGLPTSLKEILTFLVLFYSILHSLSLSLSVSLF